MLVVGDRIGGSRRVVTVQNEHLNIRFMVLTFDEKRCNVPNLLAEQLGLSEVRVAVGEPLAEEEFTQEGIQRLLLAPQLLATTAVLLVKGSEKPLENEEGSLLGVGLLGGSDKDGGVFGPVGGVFGKGGG